MNKNVLLLSGAGLLFGLSAMKKKKKSYTPKVYGGGEEAPTSDEDFGEIGPTWTFRVYPYTSGQSASLVSPDSGDSLGVNSDCSVITVGDDWWDTWAREAAMQVLSRDGSVEDAVDAVFQSLLPDLCQVSNPATFELRGDVENYVRGL